MPYNAFIIDHWEDCLFVDPQKYLCVHKASKSKSAVFGETLSIGCDM